MNKPNKCKNCQWYGKPYWSVINPCDSCPNENNYKTIITIDREPLFKEVLTEEEIEKAMTNKSIIDKSEEYLISKLEEESKNAYDDETQVSDAYIIYEEILDKVREIKNEKH